MPLTEDDLKVVRSEIGEALKPHSTEMSNVKESLGTIQQSVTQLNDSNKSLTESVQSLVDAGKAGTAKPGDKAGAKKEGEAGGGESLTKEDVAALIGDALKNHTAEQEQSAEQQKATSEWLKKHAPKLAGNEFVQKQFANAKTDDERKSVLDSISGVITATGVKAADLGANAEAEGGEAANANSEEAQKQASMDAAKQLKPARL